MVGSPPPAPDAARLAPALARLLRPLVRLMLRAGVTLPALQDLLRELYVNVAEHDFPLADGKAQTDSRISLLTGLHRKEVRRLRGAGAPVNVAPTALSRTSRILAKWLGGAAYRDGDGRPLPLPRSGPAPSFEALVESVTRDVRPRAVLDEWVDRGLVTVDADDRLTLAERALVPQQGSDQQLYYLGRNLHDHIAAATSNVLGETRFLERAVHYDGLSQEQAQTLAERARALAEEALQLANAQAQAVAGDEAAGSWRWSFGLYNFTQDSPTSAASAPEGKTP